MNHKLAVLIAAGALGEVAASQKLELFQSVCHILRDGLLKGLQSHMLAELRSQERQAGRSSKCST